MDVYYSVLTLKSGYFEIPFSTSEQLIDDIEEKTGILAIDQDYYESGKRIAKSSLHSESTKCIQVMKKTQNSKRYFIKTPSGNVKVYLLMTDTKTVKDLLYSFMSSCHRLSLNFPSDQYAFEYNGQTLELTTLMSTIPADSEINLINQSIYPALESILLKVRTLTGREILIDIQNYETLEVLKRKICEVEGIPIDQQRIIFAGKQLEENKSISEYEIITDSVLHLVLRLRGGGMPPSFTFNSMESAVKMEFSRTAPDWRVVECGVSWLGICVNSECSAFTHEVICNCGYGIFDVERQKRATFCPMCKQLVENIGGCGFFNCNFSFYGVEVSGNEREGSGEAGRDNYTAFLNGEEIEWRFLRIQVENNQKGLY